MDTTKKKDDLAALSVRISPKCFVFLNSPSKSYSVISTLSTPRSHYPYENCLYTFYHKKVGFWKCTHLNCLFLRKVAPLFRWRGCLSCCSATPGRPPGSCWRPYWTYLRGYIVTWLLDNLVTWLRSFFVTQLLGYVVTFIFFRLEALTEGTKAWAGFLQMSYRLRDKINPNCTHWDLS